MKSVVFIVAVACLQLVSTRKTFLLKEQILKEVHPMVSAYGVYDCRDCPFVDGENHFCMDQNVQVQAGWKWAPITKSYWSYEVEAYIQSDFNFHPELNIEKIFYSELSVDLQKFKVGALVQAAVTTDLKFCLFVGWRLQQIVLSVINAMSFKDCYTNLINSLCNLSNFEDGSINFNDKCTDSVSENVNFWTFTYAETTKNFIGSTSTLSCWGGK